jgi:hypothetical protein
VPRFTVRGDGSQRGAVGEPEAAISYVWQTPVGRPKKQPADAASIPAGQGRLSAAERSRLERIVAWAPEVMVKITGRTKGPDHLVAHLAYITREGKLSAETEEGIVLSGREGLRDLQSRWLDDAALDGHRRRDGTLSVNLILSMPPGTEPAKVRDAVRAFALDAFEGRHDFAFVQHADEAHPHVHLTVRTLGYDGRRLNPRKADLHHWRERFAEELRLRGVAAEATPRRARGQVRKAERGPVRAIRERGLVPRVDRLAREAILRETRGEGGPERPWERFTAKRQTAIRARYRAVAADLARSDDLSDRALAERITAFVSDMPGPSLQRQALLHDLAEFARTAVDERDSTARNDPEPHRLSPDKDR